MRVGSHNFVKFTVIKPNCQKHSGCVFASGKNAMYPYEPVIIIPRFKVLISSWKFDSLARK